MARGRSQRGAASVEHIGLILLVAALLGTLVAALAASPPTDAARGLDSLLARRLRCAPAEPEPCWRDPLTLAYGRALAGAVRALAPAPVAVAAPDGLSVTPVDFRYCRHETCAVPGPRPGLTTSNRRMTAFTSVDDRRRAGGDVVITYWLYRPGLGWTRVTRRVSSAEIEGYASTPLLDSDVPALVPLETLAGRDSYVFSEGDEPPWRGRVRTVYPELPVG
jgi:hypothetical protein